MEADIATTLAQRIADGDDRAENELVDRYRDGLRYLLRRLTGSPELAEDLTQETLRIVLERLRGRGLEDPAGLLSFLRATARNLASAERRRAHHRYTEELEAHVDPHDPQPSPAAELFRAEETAFVRKLIAELPTARDREILYRFYVAEDDKAHICTALDLSETHFNRVLHRARQRFKELVLSFQKRQNLSRAQRTAILLLLGLVWAGLIASAGLANKVLVERPL